MVESGGKWERGIVVKLVKMDSFMKELLWMNVLSFFS